MARSPSILMSTISTLLHAELVSPTPARGVPTAYSSADRDRQQNPGLHLQAVREIAGLWRRPVGAAEDGGLSLRSCPTGAILPIVHRSTPYLPRDRASDPAPG